MLSASVQFVIGDRCADLFIYWPLARGLKDDQNKDSGLLIPKVFSLFKASRYRRGHDLSARSGSRERSVSVHQKTRFFLPAFARFQVLDIPPSLCLVSVVCWQQRSSQKGRLVREETFGVRTLLIERKSKRLVNGHAERTAVAVSVENSI